ncbi:Kelch-like H-associated protein 1, partial [Coemansia helicoidea]
MDTFLHDDTACLVVRFHVRETILVGSPPTAQPSPAIAVYVPDRISAPFNQLLKSARFSDIQFELRDSSALLLSPGPHSGGSPAPPQPPLQRSLSDLSDALRISCSVDIVAGHPTPPELGSDEAAHRMCVTPMPGNCPPRALPYAQRRRLGSAEPPVPRPAGPRYHAHKAILMAVSPVFEAMFSNGMRETYERVVEVWDVTPRAFERLLEYA